MEPGQPPPAEDDFLLCLPHIIPGYHMQKKVWLKLYVSRMSLVEWNVNAFKMLVVDERRRS